MSSPYGPITPQDAGAYPGHDVLAQSPHWDDATRRVILDRVENVPPIRFFDPAQEATLRAFCDRVMAQDGEPRVPVLNMVDARLHEGRLDGYRYADMPGDGDTWRLVARGLDQAAVGSPQDDDPAQPGCFATAEGTVQDDIIQRFCDGELVGGVWDALPCARAWGVVMRMVLAAFYSHPWAWNEIGFGGPAYPRGYARLGADQREPWEVPRAR